MRKILADGASLLRYLFPIAGLISLVWFCIRVIPKPSRAGYPCQRAAAPLASAFVLWIIGLLASIKMMGKARGHLRRGRYVAGAICVLIAVAAIWMTVSFTSSKETVAAPHPANAPIGEGKGIFPGRVVWVHDPNATNWAGPTSGQYWWDAASTNQQYCNAMMSRAVRQLAGCNDDNASFDAICRSFNTAHGRGDRGYQAGEKITIKVNLVTCHYLGGWVDWISYNKTGGLGNVDTSPQMMVALIRILVNAGVAQSDIYIGDTLCWFPNQYWNILHTAYPNVHVFDYQGTDGRMKATRSNIRQYWSHGMGGSYNPDYIADVFADASYVVNLAMLKAHAAGISVCAKNHYGSYIRAPDPTFANSAGYFDLHNSLAYLAPAEGSYRALVDIMGHPQMGGKTLLYLIDGLYAGYYYDGYPRKWLSAPFNNDWPSSLLASQDPVAIDSVAFDFLLREWPTINGQPAVNKPGADDYLHEAAEANSPRSGKFYDPDGDGVRLTSLGTHEHWNNPTDKKYTRNLGGNSGIELIAIRAQHVRADVNVDLGVDTRDFVNVAAYWLNPCGVGNSWCGGADFAHDGTVDGSDLGELADYWLFGL